MEERELSYGEKAVGISFNPSGDPEVQYIKDTYAQMIDILDEKRKSTESWEAKRLLSIAITEAQSAQMWAVKAFTWND